MLDPNCNLFICWVLFSWQPLDNTHNNWNGWKSPRRFLVHENRGSPALKKIVLVPAQHQKPAAMDQGATQDQFQGISILLLKLHVLHVSAHSPVRAHIRRTGLHWAALGMQHSTAVTRGARRWHRTNKNHLKWSSAREGWRPPTEITQRLPPASHDSKLQRIWDKSLKLTPLKPRGEKNLKKAVYHIIMILFLIVNNSDTQICLIHPTEGLFKQTYLKTRDTWEPLKKKLF